MAFSDLIDEQLIRIAATTDADTPRDVISALRDATRFPYSTFRGDVNLYRNVLDHFNIDVFDDYSDEDLEFEMPLITGFKFAATVLCRLAIAFSKRNRSPYPNWE